MKNKLVIYGPTSPRGKVLKQQLPASRFNDWEISLHDEKELEGTLTEYDGGAEIVKEMTMEALRSADLVFFSDNSDFSEQYIKVLLEDTSEQKIPLIIDLSSAADTVSTDNVVSKTTHQNRSNSDGRLVRLANPLSIGLHEILSLGNAIAPLSAAQAIALIPVSEFGNAGIESLHSQVVELMNFSNTEDGVFGGQLIFNMLPGFGGGYKTTDATDYEELVLNQVAQLFGDKQIALDLTTALVPTFYSFAVNLILTFEDELDVSRLTKGFRHADGMLMGSNDRLQDQAFDGPLSVSDSQDIHIIRCVPSKHNKRQIQLWCHFDNVSATCVKHAIAIAEHYFN